MRRTLGARIKGVVLAYLSEAARSQGKLCVTRAPPEMRFGAPSSGRCRAGWRRISWQQTGWEAVAVV